ncbi:uroporphyrinogen decarboxylase family protein [Thermodesulfobacteriota bacterium]
MALFLKDFEPDMAESPFFTIFLGDLLETLDFKQLQWPGHGLDEMSGYQFIEDEYMKADEYGRLLADPTDYIIRTHWPRVCGNLKALEKLPPLHDMISYYLGLDKFFDFGQPEIVEALGVLARAGKEVRKILEGAKAWSGICRDLGTPPRFGGICQTPFDTLSDMMRGTKGAMLDMYRQPGKVIEATEKLLPMMLKMGVAAKARGVPRVFIPLHKGLDGFMSLEQFNRFYWPTLKKLIEGLIEEGCSPWVFWEGNVESRLEVIGDIPRGKAVYMFERTDVFKAKEILGDRVCIQGNVPLVILATGTPDDVKEYCKKLIDGVGKDGGFIMSSSTVLDDAKPENIKALFEFTKEYGVYS